MSDDALWAELNTLTDAVLAAAPDITVVFVANRKTQIASDSNDRATEYMTDAEATEILCALRESGFRTLYYEGEDPFIRDVLASCGGIADSQHVIVYNVAQSGTDPGRKSLIPAFCALHGIATCNSGAYEVSLARHKLHVHAILAGYAIPVPRCWAYEAGVGWRGGRRPPDDLKLIAKAAHESASIGLDEASADMFSSHLEAMLERKSAELGQPFVVQEFIAGSEVEVPVAKIGASYRALGCASITVDGESDLGDRFLHYEIVAHDAFGFDVLPPGEARASAAAPLAERACESLGLQGFARVDFRIDAGGRPFVIDVSTSPHLVAHSSYWNVFTARGWSHDRLFAAMIAVNAQRLGWI